jgi:hypothetical protein
MMKGHFFMSQPNHFRPRPNTYRIDNCFIDDYASRIGPIGVAVYNVISRHADRDSGLCRIGIQKISDKLNLSRTSVKKYLHLLFAEGLIAIIPQYLTKGGQTANHYLLLDITPQGRARRYAHLSALLRPPEPPPEHRGSPRDLPPQKSGHQATGGRSPDDPIQLSYVQVHLPIAQPEPEDDLPLIQRTCPHPPRLINCLYDGTTICHRCYKQLNDPASEAPVNLADPSAPSERIQETHEVGGDAQECPSAHTPETVCEADSERNKKAAEGGRPGGDDAACATTE